MLKLQNVSRYFGTGNRRIQVLSDVNLEVSAGESIAIVGPSGSGKSTLLGISAGLDSPSNGEVSLAGMSIENLSEDQRSELRRDNVGFVFQNFELIPTLTALENVQIPMDLMGLKNSREAAKNFLESVGLGDRWSHYPSQLSGGEQQRVAIARAFVHNPKIVFADEPTGNLDEETGESIEELLFSLNKKNGTTLILVTHNLQLAEKASRIVALKNGKIVRDQKEAV